MSSPRRMLRGAHGARRAAGRRGVARSTCAPTRRSTRLLGELERWRELAGELSRDDVLARRRARRRCGRSDGGEPGRVAVRRPAARPHPPLRRRLRARPRGGKPAAARAAASPFLDDDARRALDERGARRLQRPDPVAPRPLPLLHRLHARRAAARASSARPRATTAARARQSPFWDEVQAALRPPKTCAAGRAAGRSRRSPGRSRPRRPSASACARSPASRPPSREPPSALARANGWERRLDRALAAPSSRPTRLTHPLVLEQLGGRARRSTSPSSSASPTAPRSGSSIASSRRGTIDAEVDAKLRGSVAHNALYKFFSGLPKRARRRAARARAARRGARVPARVPRRGDRRRAHGHHRAAARSSSTRALWRDLEAVVRRRRESELAARAAPVRGAPSAPSARRPSSSAVSTSARPHALGQDRPDRRRPVQRSRDRPGLQVGQDGPLGRARSRASCGCRSRSTCSCCATSSGSSRSAGVYRAACGRAGGARDAARAEAATTAAGLQRRTTTSTRRVLGRRSSGRGSRRGGSSQRIRARRRPPRPEAAACPAWCELWPMCRVRSA